MFSELLFITVLRQVLISSTSDAFQVGLLNNTFVLINASLNHTFSDTLQQCLCRMRSDPKWLGFNHFPTSGICQFYLTTDRDRVLNITENVTASFYFSVSPSPTTEMITDLTSSGRYNERLWQHLIHVAVLFSANHILSGQLRPGIQHNNDRNIYCPCNFFIAWNASKSRFSRVLLPARQLRLAAAKMKHLMHLDAVMTRSQTRLQKLRNNN